jgi:hypothetical protein
MGGDRELQQFDSIMKNYAQATLSFENQRKEDKTKLAEFISSIEKVFRYLDQMDYAETSNLFTDQFNPSDFAKSVQLIADASPLNRFYLQMYRKLIINRLNSYTKDKKLIYDLLMLYYMTFIDCLEDHEEKQIQIQRLILLSALGFQSTASQSFMEFVTGPLDIYVQDQKRKAEAMINTKSKSKNWRAGMVR